MMEELTGVERDRARLAAALAVLSRHLDNGGELPSGMPHSCYACPVAMYLSEKLEASVGVACDIAWIEGPGLGSEETSVLMPKNVIAWVRAFDDRNEEAWT